MIVYIHALTIYTYIYIHTYYVNIYIYMHYRFMYVLYLCACTLYIYIYIYIYIWNIYIYIVYFCLYIYTLKVDLGSKPFRKSCRWGHLFDASPSLHLGGGQALAASPGQRIRPLVGLFHIYIYRYRYTCIDMYEY